MAGDPTREAAFALLTGVLDRRHTLEDALNSLPPMDARDRSAGHRLAAITRVYHWLDEQPAREQVVRPDLIPADVGGRVVDQV